jgi:hypothetical protein
MVATGSASAAPASNTQTVSVQSKEASLGGFKLEAPLVIVDPILPVPIVLTDLTVSAKATWTGDLTTKLAWNDDKVRQGADLQVARLATQTSGTMHFKWQLSGEIEGIDFGPTTIDKDNVTCDPKLSGGGFECETDSPGLALPGAVPSPIGFFVVKIFIGAKFDVTPQGAVVTVACPSAGTVPQARTTCRSPTPRRARRSPCRAGQRPETMSSTGSIRTTTHLRPRPPSR